jgi:putative transposase
LGAIIGSFKMAVTRQIQSEHHVTGIWQRNYYDRIIRDERELEAISRYIESNPLNWEADLENPQR